jgi:hypothetical protein
VERLPTSIANAQLHSVVRVTTVTAVHRWQRLQRIPSAATLGEQASFYRNRMATPVRKNHAYVWGPTVMENHPRGTKQVGMGYRARVVHLPSDSSRVHRHGRVSTRPPTLCQGQMWAHKSLPQVIEIITNDGRGCVTIQQWLSHRDAIFKPSSLTWFGARLAKKGPPTNTPWTDLETLIGQEECIRVYSSPSPPHSRIVHIAKPSPTPTLHQPDWCDELAAALLPVTDHMGTGQHIHIYTDGSWKANGSPTARILLSPEDTSVSQSAGVVVLTASPDWRHDQRAVIHIPTDDYNDNSAYPLELMSLLCGQMIGMILDSKDIECTLHSDCQSAITQSLSTRRKQLQSPSSVPPKRHITVFQFKHQFKPVILEFWLSNLR